MIKTIQPPLTQRDLDNAACGMPGCTHEDHSEVWLHGRCHMSAGTCVMYRRGTGVIVISCRQCGAFINAIEVAP